MRLQQRKDSLLRRYLQSILQVLQMKKKLAVLLFLVFFAQNCTASHLYHEKDYQNKWCKDNRGITEYVLNDKTRVDCITKNYAIEFDFADKWAESIGQSLYYSLCTNKKAGVVLIIENEQRDLKYLLRLKEVAKKYNIQVWTITPQNLLYSIPCSNQK